MTISKSPWHTFARPAHMRSGSLSLAVMAVTIIGCAESVDNAAPAGSTTDTVVGSPLEDGSTLFVNPNRRILSPQVGAGQLALGIRTDASGLVSTQVVECLSDPAPHPTVDCSVDPNFVLVGGGAWAEYRGPGALLTSSFPLDGNLTTWRASSKDHLLADVHRLHTYAIGLKLTGLNRDILFNNITVVQSTSSREAHPTTGTPTFTDGSQIIGGGARVNWSGEGNLLTASLPGCFTPPGRDGTAPAAQCWQVASKDHFKSSPATITAFAIGIRRNISGWGSLDIRYPQVTSDPSEASVASANIQVPSDSVLTAIGGYASTDFGPGRMLFRMAPADPTTDTSILIQSKDHVEESGGSATASIVVVKRAQ